MSQVAVQGGGELKFQMKSEVLGFFKPFLTKPNRRKLSLLYCSI